MLKLRNINKTYKDGKNKKIILNNINIDFNDNGLVFIVGASGSGKTTLLNIMASNIKPDSGNIYYKDKDITRMKDKYLNYYRNKLIGYIYQDYNLFDYMNVYENILIGYEKKIDIDDLLNKLGLYDKKYTLVASLSGGEKQRVAIARALINNPCILLADEPTGALDYENSINIMELLKDIAKDKLVIIVSHDMELANKYANRVIKIKDGIVLEKIDEEVIRTSKGKLRKGKLKKRKLFNIGLNNLIKKLGRTILTSLGVSLGMFLMILVLTLTFNFNKELDILEKDVVSVFPIIISNGIYYEGEHEFTGDKGIINIKDNYEYKNIITNEYIKFIEDIKEIDNIIYEYDMNMPFITENNKLIEDRYLKQIPSNKYIIDNYNILYGRNIQNKDEVLLVVDNSDGVDKNLLNSFNIEGNISYKEMIDKELGVLSSDSLEFDYEKSSIKLKIVGIIQEKEDNYNESKIFYSKEIIDYMFDMNKDSEMVLEVLKGNINSYAMDKEELLKYLGYIKIPNKIEIYVNSLDNKDKVVSKLDDYNKDNKKIIYSDMMKDTIGIVKDFINMISIILIFFTIISIIISSFMIGILTNIRVIERRKEIGILRSLGASKKNIRYLFNIENILLGVISSMISVVLFIGLIIPINSLIYNLIGLEEILSINYIIIIGVCIFNIMILLISGMIPAYKASKLDITKCIYNR